MNTTVKHHSESIHLKEVVGIKSIVHFDEAYMLYELKHFLPSQQALKDFIHHNTLHGFQQMKFYDALF